MKITYSAVAVMVLWAICYPLILLSVDYAPIMLTAFFRAFIAGFFLIAIAFLLKRPFPTSLKHWFFITLIGLTATSVGFWGMFFAGSIVSPGLATVLTNAQPIIATTLGWFILKEHINKATAALMATGFLGIVMISGESLLGYDNLLPLGTLYIFIATLGIAISNILLKLTAKTIDIFYAMGLQLVVGSIPLAVYSYLTRGDTGASLVFSLFDSPAYLLLAIGLAVPGTAIPFLIWFWLMDKAPLYRLNIYSFLTPVFGLLLGWYYFDEALNSWQWIGIFIVAASISLIGILNGRENSSEQSTVLTQAKN